MQSRKKIDALDVGRLCVSQVWPAVEWDKQETGTAKVSEKKERKEKNKAAEVDNSKPQVIIYHTHSSESYQPYSESNFHREEETGTVREVGNVMAAELNKMGIAVVHDRTVHDRPSYNQSYDRSLSTVTALLRQYPTAEIVIDLHRDAAAYTGNKGETIVINGETVAKYKLVIGQGNDNYRQLLSFAGAVNAAAEGLYPGFGGRILEKEYRYNEYIADQYLLLEVGNNQNDIEHAKNTGKYFAHVLASVLEDE
ncbi:MAG: stage II sporulation protein P [Firmicutes bacterium]|nr:stage II sporulation protein P [Bacillota bacterium]